MCGGDVIKHKIQSLNVSTKFKTTCTKSRLFCALENKFNKVQLSR